MSNLFVPSDDAYSQDVPLDYKDLELDRIERQLNEYVVGQPRAIKQTRRSLARWRAGLKKSSEPIAGLLFLGPSGVGKTYFAQVFASAFLEQTPRRDHYPLTIIRCAEFSERHTIASLIGSSAGYLGHYNPEGGPHTQAGTKPRLLQSEIDKLDTVQVRRHQELLKYAEEIVDSLLQGIKISDEEDHMVSRALNVLSLEIGRRLPIRSVILFDEVERASEELWELLIHILGEGKITLHSGGVPETSFANSVVMMTSNIGEKKLQQFFRSGKRTGLGFDVGHVSASPQKTDEEIYKIVRQEAEQTLYAPLLGRIGSGFIVFRPLMGKDIAGVLELRLREIQHDFDGSSVEHPALMLSFSDEVKTWLLAKGQDIEYGFRDLEKEIKDHIESPFAEALLARSIQSGDQIKVVLWGDGENRKPKLMRVPRTGAPMLLPSDAFVPSDPSSRDDSFKEYVHTHLAPVLSRIHARRIRLTRPPPPSPQDPEGTPGEKPSDPSLPADGPPSSKKGQ